MNLTISGNSLKFYRRNIKNEVNNHLGNVLVKVSDKKIGHDAGNGTIDNYTADVVTASDYFPFGMNMPGRKYQQGTSLYRFSINGQEKESELNENITTALYWEYDSRIGRRWNPDPKPTTGISDYASFGNNPIYNIDILGDTARGESTKSGTRLRDEIKSTFKGDKAAKLRNLFTLNNDGKTMSSIKEDDFVYAISGLSAEQQQLANGYYNTINSTDVHTVEMVYRSEILSTTAKALFGKNTGAQLDDLTYGGVKTKTSPKSTFTAVIMDNAKHVGDYINSAGISSFRASSPGELVAHELLGHGVGALKASATAHYTDAIQMSNLFLRSQGSSFYRNGNWHCKNPGETFLSKSTATQVPNYVQLTNYLELI